MIWLNPVEFYRGKVRHMACSESVLVSELKLRNIAKKLAQSAHALSKGVRAMSAGACMHASEHRHLGDLLPIAVEQAARAPVQRALGALGLHLDRLPPALS